MTRSTFLALATTCLLAACASHELAPSLDRALQAQPVVLLGEVHDNAAQHALRAQALQRLLDGGARPALLMEQFDRERQADIDRALAQPGVSADAVIAAGAPGDPAMQGWNWSYYRPYVALAIAYRLPLVAANVSRDDTRRVLKEGLLALGFDPAVPDDIRAVQAQAIVDGHCGMIDSTLAGHMVGAQVARDQFMARQVERYADRGVVLLAGDGHVRRDVGVPRWLDPSTRARTVSIGLLENAESGGPGAVAYDVTLVTPGQARADPCAAMRAPPPRP